MRNLVAFICLSTPGLVIATLPLLAEERIEQRISTVPLWPPGGNVAEEMEKYSVFLDPTSNELVVVSSFSEYRAGRLSPIRVELQNQATSTVVSKATKDIRGIYTYEYTITAALQSRRPLRRWSLLIPGLDDELTPDAPAPWQVEQEETEMVDRLASKHMPLKYVHFANGLDTGLRAGSDGVRLSIRSRHAPGYLTAFTTSTISREVPTTAIARLPKAVADELRRASAVHRQGQTSLVLGPRFDRDTPMATVASSFDYAIQHFTMNGEIEKTSQFAKSATDSIRKYLESSGGVDLVLDFLSEATSEREREIAGAMRMSLVRER